MQQEADEGLAWFGKVMVVSAGKSAALVEGVRGLVSDLAIRKAQRPRIFGQPQLTSGEVLPLQEPARAYRERGQLSLLPHQVSGFVSLLPHQVLGLVSLLPHSVSDFARRRTLRARTALPVVVYQVQGLLESKDAHRSRVLQ